MPARGAPRSLAVCGVALALTGCGAAAHTATTPLPPDYVPVAVGAGARYRPPPLSAAVRDGRPVDGDACRAARGPRYGAHLEIFVRGHVLAIARGIGIAPPVRLDTATGRVLGGRCYYGELTADPTGLIQLRSGSPHTLGELFRLWGQPLSDRRVASFTVTPGQPLIAYVGTRRWHGNPAAIPLGRHTRVVLELASHIPPHRAYVFPPGL